MSMIGKHIKGTDIYNKSVCGEILDSVICPQMIPIGPPLQQQAVPITCTAYFVQDVNTHKLHLVPPPAITDIAMLPFE